MISRGFVPTAEDVYKTVISAVFNELLKNLPNYNTTNDITPNDDLPTPSNRKKNYYFSPAIKSINSTLTNEKWIFSAKNKIDPQNGYDPRRGNNSYSLFLNEESSQYNPKNNELYFKMKNSGYPYSEFLLPQTLWYLIEFMSGKDSNTVGSENNEFLSPKSKMGAYDLKNMLSVLFSLLSNIRNFELSDSGIKTTGLAYINDFSINNERIFAYGVKPSGVLNGYSTFNYDDGENISSPEYKNLNKIIQGDYNTTDTSNTPNNGTVSGNPVGFGQEAISVFWDLNDWKAIHKDSFINNTLKTVNGEIIKINSHYYPKENETYQDKFSFLNKFLENKMMGVSEKDFTIDCVYQDLINPNSLLYSFPGSYKFNDIFNLFTEPKIVYLIDFILEKLKSNEITGKETIESVVNLLNNSTNPKITITNENEILGLYISEFWKKVVDVNDPNNYFFQVQAEDSSQGYVPFKFAPIIYKDIKSKTIERIFNINKLKDAANLIGFTWGKGYKSDYDESGIKPSGGWESGGGIEIPDQEPTVDGDEGENYYLKLILELAPYSQKIVTNPFKGLYYKIVYDKNEEKETTQFINKQIFENIDFTQSITSMFSDENPESSFISSISISANPVEILSETQGGAQEQHSLKGQTVNFIINTDEQPKEDSILNEKNVTFITDGGIDFHSNETLNLIDITRKKENSEGTRKNLPDYEQPSYIEDIEMNFTPEWENVIWDGESVKILSKIQWGVYDSMMNTISDVTSSLDNIFISPWAVKCNYEIISSEEPLENYNNNQTTRKNHILVNQNDNSLSKNASVIEVRDILTDVILSGRIISSRAVNALIYFCVYLIKSIKENWYAKWQISTKNNSLWKGIPHIGSLGFPFFTMFSMGRDESSSSSEYIENPSLKWLFAPTNAGYVPFQGYGKNAYNDTNDEWTQGYIHYPYFDFKIYSEDNNNETLINPKSNVISDYYNKSDSSGVKNVNDFCDYNGNDLLLNDEFLRISSGGYQDRDKKGINPILPIIEGSGNRNTERPNPTGLKAFISPRLSTFLAKNDPNNTSYTENFMNFNQFFWGISPIYGYGVKRLENANNLLTWMKTRISYKKPGNAQNVLYGTLVDFAGITFKTDDNGNTIVDNGQTIYTSPNPNEKTAGFQSLRRIVIENNDNPSGPTNGIEEGITSENPKINTNVNKIAYILDYRELFHGMEESRKSVLTINDEDKCIFKTHFNSQINLIGVQGRINILPPRLSNSNALYSNISTNTPLDLQKSCDNLFGNVYGNIKSSISTDSSFDARFQNLVLALNHNKNGETNQDIRNKFDKYSLLYYKNNTNNNISLNILGDETGTIELKNLGFVFNTTLGVGEINHSHTRDFYTRYRIGYIVENINGNSLSGFTIKDTGGDITPSISAKLTYGRSWYHNYGTGDSKVGDANIDNPSSNKGMRGIILKYADHPVVGSFTPLSYDNTRYDFTEFRKVIYNNIFRPFERFEYIYGQAYPDEWLKSQTDNYSFGKTIKPTNGTNYLNDYIYRFLSEENNWWNTLEDGSRGFNNLYGHTNMYLRNISSYSRVMTVFDPRSVTHLNIMGFEVLTSTSTPKERSGLNATFAWNGFNICLYPGEITNSEIKNTVFGDDNVYTSTDNYANPIENFPEIGNIQDGAKVFADLRFIPAPTINCSIEDAKTGIDCYEFENTIDLNSNEQIKFKIKEQLYKNLKYETNGETGGFGNLNSINWITTKLSFKESEYAWWYNSKNEKVLINWNGIFDYNISDKNDNGKYNFNISGTTFYQNGKIVSPIKSSGNGLKQLVIENKNTYDLNDISIDGDEKLDILDFMLSDWYNVASNSEGISIIIDKTENTGLKLEGSEIKIIPSESTTSSSSKTSKLILKTTYTDIENGNEIPFIQTEIKINKPNINSIIFENIDEVLNEITTQPISLSTIISPTISDEAIIHFFYISHA